MCLSLSLFFCFFFVCYFWYNRCIFTFLVLKSCCLSCLWWLAQFHTMVLAAGTPVLPASSAWIWAGWRRSCQNSLKVKCVEVLSEGRLYIKYPQQESSDSKSANAVSYCHCNYTSSCCLWKSHGILGRDCASLASPGHKATEARSRIKIYVSDLYS